MFNLGATLTGINTLSKAGEYVAPESPYNVEEISNLFENSKGIWINGLDPTKMKQSWDGTGTVSLNDDVEYIADSSGTGNNLRLKEYFEYTPLEDIPDGLIYGRHPASGYNQLLADSNDLTQGDEFTSSTTVCALDNSETSPVSYANVFKISRTNNSLNISGWRMLNAKFANENKIGVIYFKPATGAGQTPPSGLAIFLENSYVNFFTNGTTSTAGPDASKITNTSVTSLANGWYKLEWQSTVAGQNFLLVPLKSDGSYIINGLDMQYFVSAPQYEYGSSASAFQVSSGADDITEPNQDSVYYLRASTSSDGLFNLGLFDIGTTDEITVYAAIHNINNDSQDNIVELTNNASTTNGAFRLWSDVNKFKFTARGTVANTIEINATAQGYAALTAKAKINTDTLVLTDGTATSTSSNDLGTSNFSTHQINILSRHADSGNDSTNKNRPSLIYQLVIVNRLTTAQEDSAVMAKLEELMGV